MKIKRHKKVHRYLNFFKNNFGIRQPYQVLIDGTFCQAALSYKINLKEQLPKYLDSEVKLLTTSCVITETEKLGPVLHGAMLIVKQFPTHRCGHTKAPVPAADCLLSMLGSNNFSHYFLATQDSQLREKARTIVGTPILYLNFNAPHLERPSQLNEKTATAQAESKVLPAGHQEETLKTLKRKHFGEEKLLPKKKRKKKGSNPLSCKKKKKKVSLSDPPKTKKKARKRRKTGISQHGEEQLLQIFNNIS